MVLHPALPERDRRILGGRRVGLHRAGRAGLVALAGQAAASACRRRRSATSWPGSRSRDSSGSRTPRRAACRPTAAIGIYVDCCSAERRSARTAPTSRRGCASAGTRSTICSRTRRRKSRGRRIRSASRSRRPPTTDYARASEVRAARRRQDPGRHRRAAAATSRTRSSSRRALRPDELRQAANYLNSEFTGLPLHEVREAVLERMREERTLYDVLMARALRLASSTLAHVDSRAGSVRRRARRCCSTTSARRSRTSRSRPCARCCR